MKKNTMDLAFASLAIESKSIQDISRNLNTDSFMSAVKMLCDSEKVITCGSGSSGIAMKKFAHTLCCIEQNGIFLSPSEAVHGGMGCIKKGDTLVLASRGGKTVELIPIANAAKQKSANLIIITENMSSPLAKSANIVIPLKIDRESDPLNIMATSSFIATVALIDALIAAIMNESDYALSQFALIHPGGAVGELLNRSENTI